MTSSCRQIAPLLEAFGDEELAADKSLEVEQHLVDCNTCGERIRLNQALHVSVRSAVRSAAPVMPGFEERIAAALRAEAQREEAVDTVVEREAHHSRMLSWRSVVPVAAAAALTLVWAGSTSKHQARTEDPTHARLSTADQLLEQLVDHHMSARGPQVTEPALLRQLEPEVGVPLNLPSLKAYGARWEGANVVPVSNQHAASLRYTMGGRHVTLYVYNSTRVPIESRLKARTVRNEHVYVGTRRGVSIAATEHRGVGYALASDFNDDESAELVAAVY
jgi:anti-sigma factor RsiW